MLTTLPAWVVPNGPKGKSISRHTMDASQPTPPQELPPDVRSISEALLLRLSQWMSYDLAVNSTELLLRYQNGRLQWIAPQPRIGAARVSSDAPAWAQDR